MKKLLLTLLLILPFTASAVWWNPWTWNDPAPSEALPASEEIKLGAPTGSFYYANLLRFSTTTTGCFEGQTTAPGIVTGYFTGTDCGTGGGGVAGAISTTTPLVNTNVVYSTGVASIGNDADFTFTAAQNRLSVTQASTTLLSSLQAWFGATASTTIDSTGKITFPYSSSTIYSSFVTASTTNLIVNGETVTDLTGTGLSISGGALTSHVAMTLAGEDYLSLSTQQITANAIDPDNLSASDFGDFTCNGTTCSLDATYLTGNQTITLSGDVSGSGATSITTTIGADKVLESMLKAVNVAADEDILTYESTTGDFEWHTPSELSLVESSRALTVAGTANQITSSAGAQDLSSDKTWTLSFPNQVIFPQYASTTLGFSTPYASSTSWFGGGLTSCSNGTTEKLLYNSTTGQFSCGTDQNTGSGASTTLLADTNSWSGVNRFGYASTTLLTFNNIVSTSTGLGGDNTTDTTGRITLTSYQKAQHPNNFGEVIRINLASTTAKGMIAWYDATTTSPLLKAWIGYHYGPNDASDTLNPHDHFSIETPDASNTLRTRMEFTAANEDTSQINTFNSNFTVISGVSGVTADSGSSASFSLYDAGINRDKTLRWAIQKNDTAESGSDVGSDFRISSFSDAGSFTRTPFFIKRSTGNVGIATTTATTGRLEVDRTTDAVGVAVNNFAASNNTANYLAKTTTSGSRVFQSGLHSDTTQRFSIEASGLLEWGPGGSTARDTSLSRTAVSTLSLGADDLLITPYSSSTAYSSFNTASSTNLFLGTGQGALYTGSGQRVNAVATSTPTVTAPITYSGTLGQFLGGSSGTFDCTSANGSTKGCITSTDWTTFNSKLGTYDAFSHTLFGGQAGGNFFSATTSMMAIGTSTAPNNLSALTVSSSTASQLSLSAGAGIAQWTMRNAGGNLYFSTTTVVGTATTSTSMLSLLNSGVATMLGTLWDFGDTVLEIPNGTAPVANDPGEIAHDTSGNQLIMDDFVVAQSDNIIWSRTIASTSPAFLAGGLMPLPTRLDGFTITRIQCHVVTGTSKVIAIEDASANASEDITCATTNTTDDGTITNATYTASELAYIDFGATSGSVDYVNITVYGQWTRE